MNNVQPENGHTDLANELLDAICAFRIPGMEMQVFMAIMRKTWGWKKKTDRIALSQLMLLTGMKKQNAHRALQRLIEHKLVIKNDDKIGINKNYAEWSTFYTDRHQKRLQSSKTITLVIRNDDTSSSEMMNTKETTTKETIQKKIYIAIDELTDFHFQEIADRYSVPLSFVLSKYDDMVNWHESSGKTRKDWIATLRRFVKNDAIKIRKEQNEKSKIDFITDDTN